MEKEVKIVSSNKAGGTIDNEYIKCSEFEKE
jgi:hypothetical protein